MKLLWKTGPNSSSSEVKNKVCACSYLLGQHCAARGDHPVIKEWGEGLGAQVSRDTVIQMKKKKEDEEEGTEKEFLCMQCRSLVDA